MPDKNKNHKIVVGVLMGGISEERDVSIATGKNVVAYLDRNKYVPVAIEMTDRKEWIVDGKKMSEEKALAGCDIIFNALHGTFGEDGRMQAFLEYYGKRYTGSGVSASALAMDKLRSREIFKMAGLHVPNTLKIRKDENYQAVLNLFITKVTNFPVVVKPCSSGSSVGVKIVSDKAELDKAVAGAFRIDKKVLIEEFIEGREFTCGVLENFNNKAVSALPVTEIIPKKGHKFFDYGAKYKNGHTDEVTPAQLDEKTTLEIQEIAVKAHQTLGCRAYSRTDVILRGKEAYILETNTLPGLTDASLLPKAAKVAGLTFSQLLDKIIESSLV